MHMQLLYTSTPSSTMASTSLCRSEALGLSFGLSLRQSRTGCLSGWSAPKAFKSLSRRSTSRMMPIPRKLTSGSCCVPISSISTLTEKISRLSLYFDSSISKASGGINVTIPGWPVLKYRSFLSLDCPKSPIFTTPSNENITFLSLRSRCTRGGVCWWRKATPRIISREMRSCFGSRRFFLHLFRNWRRFSCIFSMTRTGPSFGSLNAPMKPAQFIAHNYIVDAIKEAYNKHHHLFSICNFVAWLNVTKRFRAYYIIYVIRSTISYNKIIICKYRQSTALETYVLSTERSFEDLSVVSSTHWSHLSAVYAPFVLTQNTVLCMNASVSCVFLRCVCIICALLFLFRSCVQTKTHCFEHSVLTGCMHAWKCSCVLNSLNYGRCVHAKHWHVVLMYSCAYILYNIMLCANFHI